MQLLLLLAAASVALLAQDPKEIVRLSLERDWRNVDALNRYAYEKRSVVQSLDKEGRVKDTKDRLEEVIHIDGTEIERLVEKDGKPLSAKEAAKEQKRVDEQIEKIKRESAKDRAKRRGETDKDKREEREARQEVLEAFDFRLLGEEVKSGHGCWIIEGQPKPGWKGKGRRADQFKALAGRLWIDQQSHEWVRMELDSIDTISVGWFLFRLQKGAKIEVEQFRVNDEIWVPKHVDVRADARVLGKMIRVDINVAYANFRKFSSDSKLIIGEVSER